MKPQPTMTPEQEAEWEREMRANPRRPRPSEELWQLMQPGVSYTIAGLQRQIEPRVSYDSVRTWLAELHHAGRVTRVKRRLNSDTSNYAFTKSAS